MSYGLNETTPLFRAHNTSNQTNVGLNGLFNLHQSEGCEIDGNKVVVKNDRVFVYGELKATNLGLLSFDIEFTSNDSGNSQGWQVVNNLNLWQMIGDDGIFAVATSNTGIARRQASTAAGASSAEETRIFGVRTL